MIRISYFSKSFIPGLFGLVLVVSGCSNHDKPSVAGPARVTVEVAGNPSGKEADSRTYSGTVEAADESTVSFSVPGTIEKIYVAEGQKVSKGQLLAKVKDASLINSRNIARAELEEARDAYARLKKLHDANALPDIKWVEMQSKLKQAENAADIADRAVGDAVVYSPINGYVSQKFADDGQTVIPAEPVVKIVSLNKLRVAISIPENEISSFVEGINGTVTFGVADSLKVSGKLVQKSVVADPLTRSYTVKFDLENPGSHVLPGMVADVTVNLPESDSIAAGAAAEIVLPSQAVLLSADNRSFVWVVKNGKAYRKFVVADELSDKGVTVKSGLAKGDSIIVAGMQKVSTGSDVTIVR